MRWYRSHGEQFHTKLVMIYGAARFWATLGSADLTRRNLADYDLNANVTIEGARGAPIAAQMSDYFETLWSNRAAAGHRVHRGLCASTPMRRRRATGSTGSWTGRGLRVSEPPARSASPLRSSAAFAACLERGDHGAQAILARHRAAAAP